MIWFRVLVLCLSLFCKSLLGSLVNEPMDISVSQYFIKDQGNLAECNLIRQDIYQACFGLETEKVICLLEQYNQACLVTCENPSRFSHVRAIRLAANGVALQDDNDDGKREDIVELILMDAPTKHETLDFLDLIHGTDGKFLLAPRVHNLILANRNTSPNLLIQIKFDKQSF